MNTRGRTAIDFLETYIRSIPSGSGKDEMEQCGKVEDALSALKDIVKMVQCFDAESQKAEEKISALGSLIPLKDKKIETLESELHMVKSELEKIRAECNELKDKNVSLSVYGKLFNRIFESGDSFSISVGESRKKPNPEYAVNK